MATIKIMMRQGMTYATVTSLNRQTLMQMNMRKTKTLDSSQVSTCYLGVFMPQDKPTNLHISSNLISWDAGMHLR
jgi:hypothetical protein